MAPLNTDSLEALKLENERLKKELEQAHDSIAAKEHYIEGLSQSFDGVLFLFNIRTGKFIHVGENIEKIYGYSIAELNEIPGGIFALIYEEDLHVTSGMMDQMAQAKKGQKFNMEYRIRRKDGNIVWTAIWFTPHTFAADGSLELVAGVKVETSKFKAVETENVVFDHMIEAMFAQNSVGMTITTAEGNWLRINDKFAEMLGYEPEELKTKNCPAITPQEYVAHDIAQFKAIMNGDKDVYDVEKEYLRKDGSSIWVNVHGFSIRNIHGKPEFLLSLVMDISNEVENLKQLEESENRFKIIVESSKTWFWEVDLEGQLTYLSKNHSSLTGYAENELVGGSVVKTRVDSQKSSFSELIMDLRKHPRGFADLDGRYVCADGSVIDIVSSGIPVFNQKDEVICYRGSTTDVTDRKKAEREAEKYMSDLKSSNQELEQFAYAASHDLQEPVRLMSTYTQLLKENIGDGLDDGNLRIMDHIVNSSRRMRDLINGLMEFSRVGKQELNLERVSAVKIINDVIDDFCQKIKETEAEVAIGDLPEVLCDPLLVNIVFHNLLCNSIKFRKKDVPIKVEFAAKVYDKVAEFTVTDNGIGIKEEYLDVIFTIFKRLNSRDEYEGHGIGMSVARKIVELHGCKIWVESTFGQGTTVHFTLPLPQ